MINKDKAPIPLLLVTGFLGSGKTTLLNALLRHPDFVGTAVLVNEIGTVGIDHNLVVGASDDILLLEGGCLCCQPKGSVADGVSRLLAMRPQPKRIIIETSGGANPLPILETLSQHPLAANGFQFPLVMTVVDCVFALETFNQHPEARFQISTADILMLSKTDIARPTDRMKVEVLLAGANPTAAVTIGARDTVPDGFADLVDRPVDVFKTLAARPPAAVAPVHGTKEFETVGLQFDGRLQTADVQNWIDRVVALYGGNILRIKGILNVTEFDRPAVLQCVRDIIHPMELLDARAAPDAEGRNIIVAIGWDMHPELLREALSWLGERAEQDGP